MHETRTAHVNKDGSGIIVVRIRPDATQSLADAKENLSAALAECNGGRCPLLIDIREAVPLDVEVRRYYSGNVLGGFKSLALLIDASPLGRMIGNIYLRVANTGIPTRLFTEESAALEWLRI